MKQKMMKKVTLAAGMLAVSTAIVGACYVTVYPVCEPAGTVIVSDCSITPPCQQVTCFTETGADAYAPEVAGVTSGGSADTLSACINNNVPILAVSALAYPPGPNPTSCQITETVVGSTTITCCGTIAGPTSCPPQG